MQIGSRAAQLEKLRLCSTAEEDHRLPASALHAARCSSAGNAGRSPRGATSVKQALRCSRAPVEARPAALNLTEG
jgi:hypothetical protein